MSNRHVCENMFSGINTLIAYFSVLAHVVLFLPLHVLSVNYKNFQKFSEEKFLDQFLNHTMLEFLDHKIREFLYHKNLNS